MKMKSLILIFIALACGLVASIGISQVMEGNKSGGAVAVVETEPILVALDVIGSGAKLDSQMVKLEDWPKSKIPEGAIRSLDEAKDKYAMARFFKGEPIIKDRISEDANTVTIKIPAGYRTATIKVDDDTVMEGMAPGDKVDVMVFLRRNEEIRETGTHTILKNVTVFSKGSQTERITDAKGEVQKARTVSLLLKPKQAEELALASQMGKILLNLRSNEANDTAVQEEEGDVTPITEILKKNGTSIAAAIGDGPSAGSAPTAPASSFLDQVKESMTRKPEVASVEPKQVAEPGEPPFRMMIFTPNEVNGYIWNDRKSLPVVEPVGLGQSNSQSGTSAPETKSAPETAPTGSSESDKVTVAPATPASAAVRK